MPPPIPSQGPCAGPRRHPEPTHSRIEGLDGLRGLAALCVVWVHLAAGYRRYGGLDASFPFSFGYYGVHLFFVISGFVIFMTVDRTRRPVDFVISRLSRLYPTYWASLLMVFAILMIHPMPELQGRWLIVRRAIFGLAMVQEWFGIGSIEMISWTLAAEMSFYVVMFFLICTKATRRALAVMAAWTMLAVAEHLLPAEIWPPACRRFRPILILDHVHAFTVGIVLYQARRGWRWHHAAVLILCMACAWTVKAPVSRPMLDTLSSVAVWAVAYLATTGRLAFLTARPFLFLGGISYSLYLTHYWVGNLCVQAMTEREMPEWLTLGSALTLCLAVGVAMNRLVERPTSAWIRESLKNLALPRLLTEAVGGPRGGKAITFPLSIEGPRFPSPAGAFRGFFGQQGST